MKRVAETMLLGKRIIWMPSCCLMTLPPRVKTQLSLCMFVLQTVGRAGEAVCNMTHFESMYFTEWNEFTQNISYSFRRVAGYN